MGDVHPFGNPHYWLDPDNGRVIARAIAAKLTSSSTPPAPPTTSRTSRPSRRSSRSRRQEVESRARAVRGSGGRHVPQLLAQLPEALRPHRRRVHRAQTRNPSVSLAHRRAHQPDDRPNKIPVILMEPYFDERTPRSVASKTGATLLKFIPSVGGVPQAKDYFVPLRPRRQDARRCSGGEAGRSPMSVLAAAPAGVRRQPDPHGDPRLPRACTSSSGASSSWTSRSPRSPPSARPSATSSDYDIHSTTAYLFSLGFTFLGAAIFAVLPRAPEDPHSPGGDHRDRLRGRRQRPPFSRCPRRRGETEHLKEMLVGNILSVSWPELGQTAVLYALVGVFHWVFRKKFLLISMNEAEAERQGSRSGSGTSSSTCRSDSS